MAKLIKKPRIERTHNANTMTEAAFFGKIRSSLRNGFKYWKPMQIALNNASRPYHGENRRQKKEYQCADCNEWFKRDLVEIDHIIECGSLRTWDDVVPFLQRLTQEDVTAYQILCKQCHLSKTKLNREDAK